MTAAVLVAGLPIYFCMPLGGDTTLYDMAARTVLRGGTHYRDLFDTNLPGIVWIMAAIRSTCGWGTVALRAWDLAIIAGCVCLLARWVSRAGGTGASVAWFAAAVALFYPFTSQFAHCQRDPWMLLPALVALDLRFRRLGPHAGGAAPAPRWWSGPVAEGVWWGLAVWVKPHVLAPAAAAWAVSALPPRGRGEWPARAVARDLAGTVAGGLLAGGAGVGWLVATGTWPHFVDVFTTWNPEYASRVLGEFPSRIGLVLEYSPPWSIAHLVAIPVAVAGVWEHRRWPGRPEWTGRRWAGRLYARARTGREAAARALLGALYLAWFAQAWVFQSHADYVHVPEMLLMLAVVAGQGWAIGFLGTTCIIAASMFMRTAGTSPEVFGLVVALDESAVPLKIPNHLLGRTEFPDLWLRAWREGQTAASRNSVQQLGESPFGTDWEELEQVGAFLRATDPAVGDRELLCWNDGTHPLYLLLGVEPALRYMHWNTVYSFRAKAPQVSGEVSRTPIRFVVSDLQSFVWDRRLAREPGLQGRWNELPYAFPRSLADRFPWNQPIVFRAGRYAVHQIARPLQLKDIELPIRQEWRPSTQLRLNEWTGWSGNPIEFAAIDAAFVERAAGDTLLVLDRGSSWTRLGTMLGLEPRSAVDFSRFVAVVGVSRGEQVTLSAVPRRGDLQVSLTPARRQAPGHRYEVVILPRGSLVSVNGQPLRQAESPPAP